MLRVYRVTAESLEIAEMLGVQHSNLKQKRERLLELAEELWESASPTSERPTAASAAAIAGVASQLSGVLSVRSAGHIPFVLGPNVPGNRSPAGAEYITSLIDLKEEVASVAVNKTPP